ncbi:MAG TPA: hypothetical protein VL651_07710 [Bacteroidia bacterium]|jgi:hypothetical protein|nr:hypothetical protein [Bacteroidia bacterium]
MRKKIYVAALFLLYVCIGFFREFIFLNINEQSRVTYYHDNDSHVSSSMQWLSRFSYSTLHYAKWPLTFLFTCIFAYLSALIIRIFFADREKVKLTWIIFAMTFLAGALFYFIGALLGHSYATYDIARFLAGLTETPALLIILFASFLLMKKK